MTDKPTPSSPTAPTLPIGWTGGAPDTDAFFQMAEAAIASLPDAFKAHIADLVICVEDLPDSQLLASMGIENVYELTGLYEGYPITERGLDHHSTIPDRVTLYRLPLLMEWVEGGERLDWLIRHVVIHEIGHHFGFSDEDMHALEDMA